MANSNATGPQLFFLHVPKCGGTAVLKSLSRVGKKRCLIVSQSPNSKAQALADVRAQIAARRQQPEQIDVVMGHDVFCGMDQISSREAFYFTFLREPVGRYISHYRYLIDCAFDAKHVLHHFARQRVIDQGQLRSIADYVATGDNANLMTNYLAAANHQDLSTQRWYVQDPVELVQLAKGCLERMSFIGMAESSTRDLPFVCQLLGLRASNPSSTVPRSTSPISLTME